MLKHGDLHNKSPSNKIFIDKFVGDFKEWSNKVIHVQQLQQCNNGTKRHAAGSERYAVSKCQLAVKFIATCLLVVLAVLLYTDATRGGLLPINTIYIIYNVKLQ